MTKIEASEKMVSLDGHHWSPWIIKIRGYLDEQFINFTKDEIETRFYELLALDSGFLDTSRDYKIEVIEEGF